MMSKILADFFFHIISFFVLLSLLCCRCNAKEQVVLKVFHAGSLSVPFQKIEAQFEEKYPWIDVRREVSGSVMAVRKVVDLHKTCDVVAVADYSLIPKMMFPKYADHVKLFARNELVLCYTKKSKYSEMINHKNWYKILAKNKVKWGFSNPNLDPCGYRTVMCVLLSDLYYRAPVFKMLFEGYLPFRIVKKNPLTAEIPLSFAPAGKKVFIRAKSVELIGLLEAGTIDYAMEYLSVAKQHHLSFLKLPCEINLGSLKLRSYYSKVAVVLGNRRKIYAKPIFYGIAFLKTSSHPKEAKLFEEFVTGKSGAAILKESHQTPVYPAEVIHVHE